MGATRRLFSFPNPVNEIAARTVAAGVVVMAVFALAFSIPWLLIPLTYGFYARVLTGPTLSPLGQLATRVIAPALSGVIPERICEECGDLSRRHQELAGSA